MHMDAPCRDNGRHTAHANRGKTGISKRISAMGPQKQRHRATGYARAKFPSHVTPRWAARTGPPIAWAVVPRIEACKDGLACLCLS